MDLTSPRLNTLKINTKKGYILIDPDASEDAKIVILSDDSEQDMQQTPDNLVIYGPGDYEASGILIKGTRPATETMYSVDVTEARMLLVSSSSISKLADETDYDAVVVKAVSMVNESELSALSPNLVVVYGDTQFIPETLLEKKVNKVNIKKKEEFESNVVYLEKK